MALTILTPDNPLWAKNEVLYRVNTDLTGVVVTGHLFVETEVGSGVWTFVKKATVKPDANGDCLFFCARALDTEGVLAYERPTIQAAGVTALPLSRTIRWEFYEEAVSDRVLLHTFYHTGSAAQLVQFADVDDEASYLLRVYYRTLDDVDDLVIGFGTTGSPPSGVNNVVTKSPAWQLGQDFVRFYDLRLDIVLGATLNALLLNPYVKAELYAWNVPTTSLSAIRYAVKGGKQVKRYAPLIGAPSAPTGLAVAVVSKSQLDVSWTAVTGASSYDVQRSPNGVDTWTTVYSGASNSYSNTGLADDTLYYFRVRVVIDGNPSAYTAAVSARTLYNFGSALRFDNVNDRVLHTGLTNRTITKTTLYAWLKLTSVADSGQTDRAILTVVDAALSVLKVRLLFDRVDDNTLNCTITTLTSGVISRQIDYVVGDYILIVGSINTTTGSLEIHVRSTSNTGGFAVTSFVPHAGITNSKEVFLGSTVTAQTLQADLIEAGVLDDYFITASDFNTLWNGGNGRNVENIFTFGNFVRYRFLETSGTTAANSGTEGGTATLENFTAVDIDKWIPL